MVANNARPCNKSKREEKKNREALRTIFFDFFTNKFQPQTLSGNFRISYPTIFFLIY